jgi:ParE toxin of type II toxin-antitoxin system, parDE
MEFKEHDEFRRDLSSAIKYYSDADQELVKDFIRELRGMKIHLTTFPEAAPLTSEPPIRKFLLQRFPYRIRYVLHEDHILLLTLEHMSEDKPL